MASVRDLKSRSKKGVIAQTSHATLNGAFLTQKVERSENVRKDVEDPQSTLINATQTSQSTLLLRKHKEMKEVDISLDLMKSVYNARMEKCDERRLLYEVKQAKMRDQVQKFEEFIKENDAKRVRAEAKAKNEKLSVAGKCKELSALQHEIEDLNDSRGKLVVELDDKRKYRVYLLQTIELGEGYEEIPELLARYETLRRATEELLQLNNEQETETGEFRTKLQALKTDMQNKSLIGNSIIHRYQTKLEEIRVLVRSIESEKHHLEEKKKDISRDYSQAAQSIKNLYIRCQSSVRTKAATASTSSSSSAVSHTAGLPHTEEGIDHQLDAVSHRLSDLIEISSEYRIDEDGVYDDLTADTKSLQGRSNASRSISKKSIRK